MLRMQLEEAIAQYKEAKKGLKVEILRSKSDCWSKLIRMVDDDPWGKPYKMIMRKLRGIPPAAQMETETIEKIINGLFPTRDTDLGPPAEIREPPPPVNQEEMEEVVARFKARNKTPGPDGINTRILVAVHRCLPKYLLKLFNTCIQTGSFPSEWKRARLVLLR